MSFAFLILFLENLVDEIFLALLLSLLFFSLLFLLLRVGVAVQVREKLFLVLLSIHLLINILLSQSISILGVLVCFVLAVAVKIGKEVLVLSFNGIGHGLLTVLTDCRLEQIFHLLVVLDNITLWHISNLLRLNMLSRILNDFSILDNLESRSTIVRVGGCGLNLGLRDTSFLNNLLLQSHGLVLSDRITTAKAEFFESIHEFFESYFLTVLINWESLDFTNHNSNIRVPIVSQDFDTVVHKFIMIENAAKSLEVIVEYSSQSKSYIGYFIISQAKHINFEIFLKKFLMHHDSTAHLNKDLSFLECFSIAEIVLDHFDDLLLLVKVILELLKDGGQGS